MKKMENEKKREKNIQKNVFPPTFSAITFLNRQMRFPSFSVTLWKRFKSATLFW